jgi:hypothetical protein
MLKLLNGYETTIDNIDYKTNSQKYRCPEFDSINWNDSVLLFGCSQTFGISLENYEDTVSHQLSLILNCPVINLGMGATGYGYQWINSTILKSYGISPKAVIYLWPEHTRQIIFDGNNLISNHRPVGWWTVQPNSDRTDIGVALILDEFHGTAISNYQSENVNVLWNKPTLQYTWSWPAINNHTKWMDHPVDFAVDGFHPGAETNKIRAKVIANDLKNLI